MTATTLSFYFDFGSPFAYLGASQAERLASESGAVLRYRPLLLGGLFRSMGTPDVPLFAMPQVKQQNQLRDLERFAEFWRVPFAFPAGFPVRTVQALRLVLQVPEGSRGALVMRLFRAYWAEEQDIADGQVLIRLADELGLDGQALLGGCSRPDVKALLREATEQAEAAGVFGVPTFAVQQSEAEEPLLFWGQDRVPLVERALSGWRPRNG